MFLTRETGHGRSCSSSSGKERRHMGRKWLPTASVARPEDLPWPCPVKTTHCSFMLDSYHYKWSFKASQHGVCLRVVIYLVCKYALVRVKCATQVTCKLLSKRFYVIIADASNSLQKLDTVESTAKASHGWPSLAKLLNSLSNCSSIKAGSLLQQAKFRNFGSSGKCFVA